jgi:Na+/H+-dicarboxylate symporter
LFVSALKLIVVPLVASAVVLAVARLKSGSDLGRLGLKTVTYYLCTSLIAILIGLFLVDVVRPGVGVSGQGIFELRDLSAFQGAQAEVAGQMKDRTATAVGDFFRRMVPENIFSAALTDQLLGILVVALAVGFFLGRLGSDAAHVVVQFTQGVYDVTMKICELLLALTPIGVLALLAVTLGEQYALLAPAGRFGDFARGMALFAAVVVAGLLVHVFVALFLILRVVARVSPTRHFRAMLPASIAAFATASSPATLPLAMECVEERAGVSRRTASFVMPLGATINMDAGVLYACVAAVFVCQAFGVHLSFGQHMIAVAVALMTSIGVAGVPAASLVGLVIILQAVQPGLPEGAPLVAALGVLLVLDRPLQMLRTAVNVYSDACGAAVVGRTEGELLARIS